MKTRNLLSSLIALFLSVLIISCSDDDDKVVAAFSVSDAEVDPYETITFTNESENASYYQWIFGDGEVAIDKNPSHSYSSGGDYEVQLIAIGSGSAESAFMTINVTADYDITIYEGEGIEGTDIYDTWSEINATYSSDTILSIEYNEDYGVYRQDVLFYEEGISFTFWTETTTLSNSAPAYYIYLLSPYEGATYKGISIGSDIDDVTDRYGDEEDLYDGDGYTYYGYDSIGIGFFIPDDSDKIDEIVIYEAAESSSLSVEKAGIPDIIKYERNNIPVFKK